MTNEYELDDAKRRVFALFAASTRLLTTRNGLEPGDLELVMEYFDQKLVDEGTCGEDSSRTDIKALNEELAQVDELHMTWCFGAFLDEFEQWDGVTRYGSERWEFMAPKIHRAACLRLVPAMRTRGEPKTIAPPVAPEALIDGRQQGKDPLP